jgi:hypothetical protein
LPQFLPPLWPELVRIFAVDILAAMHGPGGIADLSAGLNEDRRFAVWPSPEREDRVFDGDPAIDGNSGTQHQYLALDQELLASL